MSGCAARRCVGRSVLALTLLRCWMGAVGLHAQEGAPAAAAAVRTVGTLDLFGYAGWDGDDPHTAALREKLAARIGAEVRMGAAAAFRRQVQGDVIAVTGKPATDVAVICCNEKGTLSVFVGVQGESSIPLEQRATPTGSDVLPPEALALYTSQAAASESAVSRPGGEDDSQGYALSRDPALRAQQEQMRAFAVAHADVIVRVLRRSSAVQQRAAAALLLGYAQRSPAQVHALEDAADDDDEGVRNNALRALGVLAAVGPLPGLNPEQMIALLYSGIWTDRNKASLLLVRLTKDRDAKLLRALREQALPPLIEGARWRSKDHASNFAIVLGRLAGMPEEQIAALVQAGMVSEIVRAARALETRPAKR